jgi:diguanylate cyclase (GGDEF)-like protein
MGGDEFCFVLFAKDEAGLSEGARRVQAAFGAMEVDVGGAVGKVAVTSSVGMVRLERSAAGSEEALERVLKRADELMYGVKRGGKGRCEIRLGAA